jgi:hypothetical protein
MPGPVMRSFKVSEIPADGFIRRLQEERDYIENLQNEVKSLKRKRNNLEDTLL